MTSSGEESLSTTTTRSPGWKQRMDDTDCSSNIALGLSCTCATIIHSERNPTDSGWWVHFPRNSESQVGGDSGDAPSHTLPECRMAAVLYELSRMIFSRFLWQPATQAFATVSLPRLPDEQLHLYELRPGGYPHRKLSPPPQRKRPLQFLTIVTSSTAARSPGLS